MRSRGTTSRYYVEVVGILAWNNKFEFWHHVLYAMATGSKGHKLIFIVL